MFTDPITTVAGNLAADPELRFTASGTAVATFTVCHTPRVQRSGEWVDGETLFLRCTAWRDLAEHAAESLRRGTRVVVVGRLGQRTWETAEGEKRYSVELTVDELGASLRFATVHIYRQARNAGPAPADPRTGEEATERSRPEPSETGAERPPAGPDATTGTDTPAESPARAARAAGRKAGTRKAAAR